MKAPHWPNPKTFDGQKLLEHLRTLIILLSYLLMGLISICINSEFKLLSHNFRFTWIFIGINSYQTIMQYESHNRITCRRKNDVLTSIVYCKLKLGL